MGLSAAFSFRIFNSLIGTLDGMQNFPHPSFITWDLSHLLNLTLPERINDNCRNFTFLLLCSACV